MRTPHELAQDVIVFLKKHGWVQGVSCDESTNRHCMYSAILMTRADHNEGAALMDEIHQRIKAPIPNWNDAPGRTLEDVIVLLERIP